MTATHAADAPPARSGSLARRLARYQAVRFPLAAYLPLIALAAFSAIAYSRAAREATGLVSAGAYLVCAFTLLAGFFTLRVADEHKDADTDRRHRPHLPVPSGVVTLRELRMVAGVLVVAAAALNALLDAALLVPLLIVAAWVALMTREFFVRDWLRVRPVPYLLSHMVVMPLLFLYASSVDWLAAGAGAPRQLGVFLAAVFASGLALEIGRKVRAPGEERPGVETYSGHWGERTAAIIWVAAVVVGGTLVAVAGAQMRSAWTPRLALVATLLVAFAALPALRGAPGRSGRRVELAGGLWNLIAFALLALPWLERLN